MQLARNPRQCHVIVTDNLFGGVVLDEAAMVAGSLGIASFCIGRAEQRAPNQSDRDDSQCGDHGAISYGLDHDAALVESAVEADGRVAATPRSRDLACITSAPQNGPLPQMQMAARQWCSP